jgi:hypothetical protein
MGWSNFWTDMFSTSAYQWIPMKHTLLDSSQFLCIAHTEFAWRLILNLIPLLLLVAPQKKRKWKWCLAGAMWMGRQANTEMYKKEYMLCVHWNYTTSDVDALFEKNFDLSSSDCTNRVDFIDTIITYYRWAYTFVRLSW